MWKAFRNYPEAFLGLILPRAIGLEASSLCQLKCPACPRFTEAFGRTIGHGYLRLSDFQRIIAANPRIKQVELANYGEIFLNPELLPILEHAWRKKITVTADHGVNLNDMSEDLPEGLVKYGFFSLTCSVDGASQATYSRYRRQGHLDLVIENINKINYFKEKYRSSFPILTWQFVIFGHNEHELPQARQMARDLGMNFYPKLTWDEEFSPIRNQEFVKREAGLNVLSRSHFKKLYGVDYMQSICHQLWDQPQINWDGKVLGCCRNFWGDFGGNAFTDELSVWFNNERLAYARAMLVGQAPPRKDIPCSTCDIYMGMRQSGRFLKRDLRYQIRRFMVRNLNVDRWRQALKFFFSF